MNDLTPQYYKNERKAIAALIEKNKNDILDVGCGAGYFGKYLKESGRAASVCGIELVKEVAEHAKIHLDAVVSGDLDEIDVSSELRKLNREMFDIIVFADVLEHTKNPWRILFQMTEHLKDAGIIIISLPNIRHWKVIFNLLFKGRWDYVESGILDRTHLRFFTRSTATDLIESSHLNVEREISLMGNRAKAFSKLTNGILKGFMAEQHVFVCRKKSVA